MNKELEKAAAFYDYKITGPLDERFIVPESFLKDVNYILGLRYCGSEDNLGLNEELMLEYCWDEFGEQKMVIKPAPREGWHFLVFTKYPVSLDLRIWSEQCEKGQPIKAWRFD